jgi:tmRNA-binding protein
MSRTLKNVQTEEGLKKCQKYSSSGTPFCIYCKSRMCHGEIEIARGKKSLTKTKFIKPKYKMLQIQEDSLEVFS